MVITTFAMMVLYFGSETTIEVTPSPTPISYTYDRGSRFASESDIEWLIVEKAKQYGVRPSLVLTIIENESGFKWWICHAGTQCDKGGGLVQVIPSTERYCEEKLGRELDMKVPEDNLDCGFWLLKNEGISHWEAYSGPYHVKD